MSKLYRLGEVGTGTLTHDLNKWWHKVRGKEDPYSMVGVENDRTQADTTGYVWALQDLDFKVEKGQILGIIGKNGAGKSTLLKILSRITGPTTGNIRMRGRVASLLEVGTGMHQELTGRENIMLNGAILGMSKQEILRKFDDIVDFSGCAKYVDTPIKRYSSGMKVRLGFAVAAFLEPEILIVDEVLAVGDAEFQKRAIGKMQDVTRGGDRTVLFVSHNMYSIKQLCSDAIVLDNGRIALKGAVNDCVEYYLKRSRGVEYAYGIDYEKLKMCKCEELDFTDIEIINHSREDSEIRAGDHLTFRFHYQCYTPIASFGLELVFMDYQEQQVISFKSNPNSGFLIDELSGKGYIDLEIKELTLVGGTYYINVRAYKRLVKTFFGQPSLIKIDIKPEDVYRTGYVLGTESGLMWMHHRWTLNPSN